MRRVHRVASFFLFALLALSGRAWAGPLSLHRSVPSDPDSLDLQQDISSLSVEELRLNRAAVQARHCHEFTDTYLRKQFFQYQWQHCGMHEDYFRTRGRDIPEKVAESELNAEEKAFIARLDQREKELLSGDDASRSPAQRAATIVNASQFSTLPDSAVARLLRDGFVVVPGKREQLFHVYEENDYHMIPNFITTDAMLQLYHLYFDFTLRRIEESRLMSTAAELSRAMRERLSARWVEARWTPEDDGLRRATLYFAMAEILSGADSAATASATFPLWVEEDWKPDLERQWSLIREAGSSDAGPIVDTVDYTMFKVRGHYTRNPTLGRFFRTMMWLSLPGFALDDSVTPGAMPLAIAYELTHDPGLMELYNRIYEPTGFYVGPSDDIAPMLLREAADGICGAGAPLEAWMSKKREILRATALLDPRRIRPIRLDSDSRSKPQLHFMGMRYIPDSEIFQKVLGVTQYPSGLDLFGIMGVPAATEILRADSTRGDGYWSLSRRMQGEFGDFRPPADQDNLYWRWLHALRTLNQPAPEGAAACMRTDAWKVKDLSTSLASWSELRHDTILYGKQFDAECGGGDEEPHYVGYVEARPDFFAELLELQRFTYSELERRGLLDEKLRSVAGRIEEMLVFLERTSRMEVNGEALSRQDYDTIRISGSELEMLTLSLLADHAYDWNMVQGADRSMAVVADIGTSYGETLEVGVGLADQLYALVTIGGDLYITRGAVFSFYEFWCPAGNRLTDEEWQRSLREQRAPARPPWIKRFFLDQPVDELPARYRYSTGC